MTIPVSETYWSLVAKADKKFSKMRDLPSHERNRYDSYFYKVFKVYTQLWKFQQENRHKLVEAGLKRWEIGDIASRIGQLYFGQYMRTSDSSYLSESYIFYEAVLSREYFKDDRDLNLANKQLRFLARFLIVCLALNRREMLHLLVHQLRTLVDECTRNFQETDFKDWKLVIQEIVKFLNADTAFMNIRPLRYSLVLDLHPDLLPHVTSASRKLKLRDAILTSYYPSEVKFSELTIDTFRMLQCLEWEPSGLFYQPSGTLPCNTANSIITQNGGASRTGCISHSQHISDPTLPPNPRKAVLHRPTVSQFLAVLANMCEDLPPDGVLLIYLSASGCSTSGSPNLSFGQGKEDSVGYSTGGLRIGACGNGGLDFIYPCDFIPFTRRPLFLVIDSDCSKIFKVIKESEKGEPVAMLLSPSSSPCQLSHQPSGNLFTCFLIAPLQAFCLLLGVSGTDMKEDIYQKAQDLLSSLLNDWGSTLAASATLDSAWAQVLNDPFLRRLLLRFIFCRAVMALYSLTFNKEEFVPECAPCLPESVLPMAAASQTAILRIANIFGATNVFVFSKEIELPKSTCCNEESMLPH